MLFRRIFQLDSHVSVSIANLRIPRTVGFRFKYSSKGSGIADGTSEAKDFTWTAAQ